jgi:hypothetical protein
MPPPRTIHIGGFLYFFISKKHKVALRLEWNITVPNTELDVMT